MRNLFACAMLSVVLAGCKEPCTTKHLGFTVRDGDTTKLTVAQGAGWNCAVAASRLVNGHSEVDYACTKCD